MSTISAQLALLVYAKGMNLESFISVVQPLIGKVSEGVLVMLLDSSFSTITLNQLVQYLLSKAEYITELQGQIEGEQDEVK